jgi:hypothetical protein
MTEKKKSEAKRKYHCACATGDLSAIQPVTAPLPDQTTAKPIETKRPQPPMAVAPGEGDQPKARG